VQYQRLGLISSRPGLAGPGVCCNAHLDPQHCVQAATVRFRAAGPFDPRRVSGSERRERSGQSPCQRHSMTGPMLWLQTDVLNHSMPASDGLVCRHRHQACRIHASSSWTSCEARRNPWLVMIADASAFWCRPFWFQADNLLFGLCRNRQRLPSCDDPHALASFGVIGDEREMPAQLDDGGKLAVLVERTTDCLGGCFIDAEHSPPWERCFNWGK